MKVLAICAFPIEFPCTRYRLMQYVEPLRKHGIELDVRPFFSSAEYSRFYENTGIISRISTVARPLAKRIADIAAARSADVILVQREAMLFGPAIFEWLYRTIGRKPMILDLDDAVYIPYESERYGRLGNTLKFFGKTNNLVRNADLVICGGRFVAEYAESLGAKSIVIPTVVDPEKFKPVEKNNDALVIGWIGTASTYPFLESLFPVLQRLAERHPFLLRIRGSGRDSLDVPGLQIDNQPWSLEKEIGDFQSLDIGLYPLAVSDKASLEWLRGKSGFKAIQYMTLGLPFVMSPVGVTAEMGIAGETHFEARNAEEWEENLRALLTDSDLRKRMGEAGRAHALREYNPDVWAEKLAALFNEVVTMKIA